MQDYSVRSQHVDPIPGWICELLLLEGQQRGPQQLIGRVLHIV